MIVPQAMRSVGQEPFPTIYVDSKTEGEVCRLTSLSSPFDDVISCTTAMGRGFTESVEEDEEAFCG